MANVKNTTIKSVLNAVYMTGADRLAGKRFAGIGAILMLHHVRRGAPPEFAPNAHLTVTPDFLDRTLSDLRRRKVDIVSMDEIASRLENGTDAPPCVALTFDDAYRDNVEEALPVLERHAAPFTVYAASALVEGGADIWWEGVEEIIRATGRLAVPGLGRLDCSSIQAKHEAFATMLDYLTSTASEEEQRRIVGQLAGDAGIDLDAARQRDVLSREELTDLSRSPLCTLGAHTIHHYALARLSADDAMKEIAGSAGRLSAWTGLPVQHFAYPYGYPAAAGPREFGLAEKAGFRTAVNTRAGVLYPAHGAHMTALPRISLNGHFQAERYTRALLCGLPTLAMNGFRRLNVD